MGLAAVAYEPHPFFAIISEAKANSHRYWPHMQRIQQAIWTGLQRDDRSCDLVSGAAATFLGKSFREEDLGALCSARHELDKDGLGANPLAILILSRILDHCCFAATDGIYKAPTSRKRGLTTAHAFERVTSTVMSDQAAATFHKAPVHIHQKSSERWMSLVMMSLM